MAQDINISVKVDTSQAQQQTENYKKRLKELKDEMTALQIETDGLSKASAEQRKRFNELEQEAGKIQDAMGDTAQRVKNLSDDYRGMTTALEGIGGAVGGITAVQGAINLLGGDSDIAAESIKKITSLMGILQGIQNVQKVLNKDSATMTALLAVKNKLLTTSIQQQTTAQLALNAAKLGMVGAIAAVVAALAVMIAKYASAKNAVADLSKEIDKQAAESTSKLITDVMSLKKAWDELGGSMEDKAEMFQNLKDAQDPLVEGFETWEEFETQFIANTDTYIQAQMERAKAAAARGILEQKTKEYLEEQMKNERIFVKETRTFWEEVALAPLEWIKGKENVKKAGQEIGATLKSEFETQFTDLTKQIEEFSKNADTLFASIGLNKDGKKDGGDNGDKTDAYLKSVEEKYKLSAANIKKEYFDIINNESTTASQKYQAAKKMEGELIDAEILKLQNQNKAIGKNTSQYAENELKIKELTNQRENLYKVEVDETTEEEELERLAGYVNVAYEKQANILEGDLVPATELFGDKLDEIDRKEKKRLKNLEKNAEDEAKIRKGVFDIASNAANAYLDLVNANMEMELEEAEGNEEEQAKIRKKYAKQQFIGQIASIASSAAKAIMEAWEAYGAIPGAGPALVAAQSAVIGATAMAQTIAAQTAMNTAMKAARGGILNGQSHANGGIMLSNGVEAEGGEAIINKRSTAAFAPLLSEINSYNGYGAPLIRSNSSAAAALGGGVGDEAIQKIVSATVAGVTAIPVVVSEHSITEAQRTVGITRDRSFI